MKRLILIIVGLLLLMALMPFAATAQGEYTIVQLTDNYYDDVGPQIDAGMVVWHGNEYGKYHEIFLWDGSETVQLTNNEYHDSNPQIDAGQVVWNGSDGHDYEIFLWNGSEIIQITDNDYDDLGPQINAGQIVWQGSDGNDYEIFMAVPGSLTPSEQIDGILDFFDDSVEDGSLVGDGPGNSAQHRLLALRNMIEAAGYLIEQGYIEAACQQLMDVYKHVDGLPRPPDFAVGEAAAQLAEIILDLMADLGCQ